MWNPFSLLNFPKGFLTTFIKSQWTALPYPAEDFSGKTIIVTGANVGLGLEASRHFVRLGASKVILACRNHEKGEAAKKDIEQTTGRTGVVEVWEVDLSSYKSVKHFCKQVETLDRVDAVVENAGIGTSIYKELEGMESTITVNVISTFLMASLLLQKLRADGEKFGFVPNLVIVASEAHEQARFVEQSAPSIFPALNNPKNQDDRYNVSKLLEILVLRELAPAMSSAGKPKVTLNALTPGFCHSTLMRDAQFPLNIFGPIVKFFLARTTEEGSRTIVSAAVAPEDTHGRFLRDCRITEPSAWVRSEEGREVQVKVYMELLEILEGIELGVTAYI